MAAVKTVAAGELPAWEVGELPEPPAWNFANVMKTIGPGAILLGISIGSGEWLAGPAVVVRYGLAMLWVTTVSVILQVLLNMEFVRYTLYSGEPIFSAFMRLKPGSTFWGWFWVSMFFLQVGWPGWAGSAGAGLAQIILGPAGKVTPDIQAWMGVILFLLCVVILTVGQKIERSLELAQWFMIAWIIGFLIVADLFLVPLTQWPALIVGFFGFNAKTGSFMFIPPGADFFLLGGFAAYSGAGGTINATITNWMRDKGFGMGSVVGYIPSLIGGKQIKLEEGALVRVELLDAQIGASVSLRPVFIADGDKVVTDAKALAAATVTAEVVEHVKDDKVIVFKFKKRKKYRRKTGHRQEQTRVRIAEIVM